MRRHWWWRPGWRPGRRLYAWHLTFGDRTVSRGRTELRRVVGAYQARLTGLPGLDLVPIEWLHLTVQPVGFADEVGAGDAERIVAAVRRRRAALAPLRLTLGPAQLQAEGVWLPVAPHAAVRRVRPAVRAGIAEVWGAARVPEAAGAFTPHVSLAYSNTDGLDEPFAAALAGIARRSATVEFGAIQLIALRRDERLYRWETAATVPLVLHHEIEDAVPRRSVRANRLSIPRRPHNERHATRSTRLGFSIVWMCTRPSIRSSSTGSNSTRIAQQFC